MQNKTALLILTTVMVMILFPSYLYFTDLTNNIHISVQALDKIITDLKSAKHVYNKLNNTEKGEAIAERANASSTPIGDTLIGEGRGTTGGHRNGADVTRKGETRGAQKRDAMGTPTNGVNGTLNLGVNNTLDWFSHCDKSYRQRHLVAMKQRARTGNRLFQLFCVLALSRDYCYTAVLDPGIRYLDELFDIYHVRRAKVNKESFKRIRDPHEASEKTLRKFNESFYDQLNTKRNWTIYDFHQSYKYFQHQSDFVKSAVQFKPHIMKEVKKYLKNEIELNGSSCAIHVRRRDITRPEEYYLDHLNKSINYVRDRIKGVKFIFLSDDIKWCKKKFKAEDISYSPFVNPAKDLALMALSDHSILTHGTFGWMGAWLGNKRDNALILYPAKFGNPNKAYYPPNWTNI